MPKTTSGYAGFIFAFEPKRSKKILALLKGGKNFHDSFSVDDWDLARREIFFLTLNRRGKEIDAAVLVQRAHGDGGTGKPKYELGYPVRIDPPIRGDQLKEIFPVFSEHVSTSARSIRIEESTWEKLIQEVKSIRPEVAEEIDGLLELIDKKTSFIGGSQRRDRLAEQRDGLGTALEIAGINKGDFLKELNEKREDEANSILELFDDLPIHERHLMDHDKEIIERVFPDGYRGARFQGSGVSQVRVYVADKTKLETALGTDLIIYQSLWNSFIFVQYKVMSKSQTDKEGWSYRTDAQFDDQLEKMNKLMVSYPPYSPQSPWDFRLSDEPNFFKFCEKRTQVAREDSLVRGLSIDRKDLLQFLNMKESEGPNGGVSRIVGYKNCPRYMNNTEFKTFAQTGWIGSSGPGTTYLKEQIDKILSRNREPILAVVDIPRMRTAELRKASRTAAQRTPRKIKNAF